MQMADLVTKIVRASNSHGKGHATHRFSTGGKPTSEGTSGQSKFSHSLSKGHNSTFQGGTRTQIEVGDRDSDLELDVGDRVHPGAGEHGIMKTVQTTIDRVPAVDNDRDDAESRSSSTRKLHFRSGYEQ